MRKLFFLIASLAFVAFTSCEYHDVRQPLTLSVYELTVRVGENATLQAASYGYNEKNEVIWRTYPNTEPQGEVELTPNGLQCQLTGKAPGTLQIRAIIGDATSSSCYVPVLP